LRYRLYRWHLLLPLLQAGAQRSLSRRRLAQSRCRWWHQCTVVDRAASSNKCVKLAFMQQWLGCRSRPASAVLPMPLASRSAQGQANPASRRPFQPGKRKWSPLWRIARTHPSSTWHSLTVPRHVPTLSWQFRECRSVQNCSRRPLASIHPTAKGPL
jgi:hypothetical protein